MQNPFQSRKFVYAVTGVIMFLVVAYLPVLTTELGFDLSANTLKTVNDTLPWVLVLAFALIGGHTIQDALSIITGYQANENLRENIESILDEVLGEKVDLPQEGQPQGES